MKKSTLKLTVATLLLAIANTPQQLTADVTSNNIGLTQLQAAIEAFGVTEKTAEQATLLSLTMIKNQQEPIKKQEIASMPDDLLDMSPY